MVAEKLSEKWGIREAENCSAEAYQVEQFLLGEIKDLLSGKDKQGKDIVLVSYVKPEDDDWSCNMPKKIWLEDEGKSIEIADYQWFQAASDILLDLGFDIHVVLEELNKEKGVRREEMEMNESGDLKVEIKTLEKTYPLEQAKLKGELSRLAIGDQFEIAIVVRRISPIGEETKKIVGKSEGWQILVRRKSAP